MYFWWFSIYGKIQSKNIVVSVTLSLCLQYNSTKIVYEHNTMNKKTPGIFPTMASSSIYLYVCVYRIAQHGTYAQHTFKLPHFRATFACTQQRPIQKFMTIYCVYQNIKKNLLKLYCFHKI